MSEDILSTSENETDIQEGTSNTFKTSTPCTSNTCNSTQEGSLTMRSKQTNKSSSTRSHSKPCRVNTCPSMLSETSQQTESLSSEQSAKIDSTVPYPTSNPCQDTSYKEDTQDSEKQLIGCSNQTCAILSDSKISNLGTLKSSEMNTDEPALENEFNQTKYEFLTDDSCSEILKSEDINSIQPIQINKSYKTEILPNNIMLSTSCSNRSCQSVQTNDLDGTRSILSGRYTADQCTSTGILKSQPMHTSTPYSNYDRYLEHSFGILRPEQVYGAFPSRSLPNNSLRYGQYASPSFAYRGNPTLGILNSRQMNNSFGRSQQDYSRFGVMNSNQMYYQKPSNYPNFGITNSSFQNTSSGVLPRAYVNSSNAFNRSSLEALRASQMNGNFGKKSLNYSNVVTPNTHQMTSSFGGTNKNRAANAIHLNSSKGASTHLLNCACGSTTQNESLSSLKSELIDTGCQTAPDENLAPLYFDSGQGLIPTNSSEGGYGNRVLMKTQRKTTTVRMLTPNPSQHN